MTLFLWMGIVLCISQSAMLSGLNLAFFTISRLELRIEVAKGNRHASRVLALREDSNFLLVTILWGNVAVNVLLALLSGSVLAGLAAFLFSTVVITVFGEILPQAYFSRHALKIGSLFSPVLRCYQILLFPVAKPTAMILDRFLGPEAISYFKEKDIRQLIQLHMEASESDIEKVEGQGALNFLEMDDVPLDDEGESIHPESVLKLDFDGVRPLFPRIAPETDDGFLQAVNKSGKGWAVIVDPEGEPRLVLRTDDFIREALFAPEAFNPYRHCHRPIVVRDAKTKLGNLIPLFQVRPGRTEDDIIDNDVILLWGSRPRVVTGTDILGRLLRGIARR